MRSISVAFILGLLVGSVFGPDLSSASLSILLVIFFLAGIVLKSEILRTIVFLLSFFIAGVLRITLDDAPMHLDALVDFFVPLRNMLSEGFASYGIIGDENAVVTAMSLGDRSGISPHLKSVYSQSGASHVLALSGMHLSIIYFILSWVVK